MQTILQKYSRWLQPCLVALLALVLLTMPWMLGVTYSGRSESPDHILTYTEGKLTWDSATGIDETGAARLNLFDASYSSVVSADGVNVVAPGTEGFHIVRLKNDVSGSIRYQVVLYRIHTNDALPVQVSLSGENMTDVTQYPVPEGVSQADVIRAAEGTVAGGQIQDFDIQWLWAYYEDAQQDAVDTMLGDDTVEESDEITVGIYIVVEDGNSYITPDIPQTGDRTGIEWYLVLMGISLVAVLLLLCGRKRMQA